MKKIYAIVMAAFVFCTALVCLFKPEGEFSNSERRRLAQFPEFNIKTLASGKFMSEFETFAQDQFPARDALRGIKSNAVLRLFMQQDNNDLFMYRGHIIKKDYPVNYDMLDNAAGKLEKIYKQYLEDTDCKVYFSIIPDKSNFVPASKGMLSADFSEIEKHMTGKLGFMEYVDIEPLLTLTDYYRSDSHWKQECIEDVAEKLASAMGSEVLSYYEYKSSFSRG